MTFERFSDSAGSYIALDSNNPAVYKQLYRAAKAKLKLRIKATVTDASPSKEESTTMPDSRNAITPNVESAAADQHLLSGLTASTLDSAPGLKTSSYGLGQDLARPNLRPKLPYDPCLSPSVTTAASKSILESANPVIDKPKTGLVDDYHMKLMLLEQQNKKRLLMSCQSEAAKARQAEAPVPKSFTTHGDPIPELASMSVGGSKYSTTAPKPSTAGGSYTICCNSCEKVISNDHWHCSTCDANDYDICARCIEQGILCEGEDHWLIKRTIKNGEIVNSTTETIAPKTAARVKSKQSISEASSPPNDKETPKAAQKASTDRNCNSYWTCNSCVEGEKEM